MVFHQLRYGIISSANMQTVLNPIIVIRHVIQLLKAPMCSSTGLIAGPYCSSSITGYWKSSNAPTCANHSSAPKKDEETPKEDESSEDSESSESSESSQDESSSVDSSSSDSSADNSSQDEPPSE